MCMQVSTNGVLSRRPKSNVKRCALRVEEGMSGEGRGVSRQSEWDEVSRESVMCMQV